MRTTSKSSTAQSKKRIQALLRELAIRRDGGCVLSKRTDISPCSGYSAGGNLILQYDHLHSRAFGVSFADLRLGVILCKGHHFWKSKVPGAKERYDDMIREIIEPARVELWNRVKADRKIYHRTASDWDKEEMALIAELKNTDNNEY